MFRKQFAFLVSALMIIGFILTFPVIFADSNIIYVQDNANAQLSNSQATCQFLSPIQAQDTLVVSFDAVFINNGSQTIGDTLHNTWKQIGFALNSASTWVQVWEVNKTNSAGADTVTINYTSASNGSYGITCDELQGEINFVNAGGQISSNNNCNTCNMNLTATTHKINLLYGWFESTANPPLSQSYASLANFVSKTDAFSCQQIGGSSNCIFMLHAIAQTQNPVVADSAITINCSPSCSQNPAFIMDFYVGSAITGTTVTSTVTGWLIPNFANNVSSYNWFYLIIVIFIPFGVVDMVLFMGGRLTAKIFTFFLLLGLALGATFGSMLTLTPVALIPIFWGVFIIYIWRFRG